jgi:hypothetical protein
MINAILVSARGHTPSFYDLGIAIRLRGIVPWIDRDRGFELGDNNADEARRVIREDCFGLLLYASRNAFGSPFIRKVELQEAKRVKKKNPNYLLVAVPRAMSFGQLETLSKKHFGIDLSDFYTVAIPETIDVKPILQDIARLSLRSVLDMAYNDHNKGRLSIQISTRETLPDRESDILRVDASGLFSLSTEDPEGWKRLKGALSDVKKEISFRFGRPRLDIHGSRHLTAAFLIGRVFSPFLMDVMQRDDYWFTDDKFQDAPFESDVVNSDSNSDILSVEVSVPGKTVVEAAVDRLSLEGFRPCQRIKCSLMGSIAEVNGPMTRDIVRQVRHQIENALSSRHIHTIHLFAAVPQGLMVMLGRELGPFPPTQLYEFTGTEYLPSLLVPSGAL